MKWIMTMRPNRAMKLLFVSASLSAASRSVLSTEVYPPNAASEIETIIKDLRKLFNEYPASDTPSESPALTPLK